MLAREQRLVAREGHEGGELRARGIADQPDPVGIEAEPGGFGAHELHRRLGVVYRAGPSLHTRLHQPVLDRKHGIAVCGEVISPVRVELAVTDLPSPASQSSGFHWRHSEPSSNRVSSCWDRADVFCR